MRKFLLFLVMAFSLTSPIYALGNSLNVGHIDFPPFYINSGQELKGMDADIVRKAGERAGYSQVLFKNYNSLPELIGALNDGSIDIIVNGIISTPERKQKYLLSIPYYLNGGLGILYSDESSDFKSPQDLKDHKVGVLLGSYPQTDWLQEQQVPKNDIKSYNTLAQLIAALNNKEVDVIVTNYTVCQYEKYLSKNKLKAQLLVSSPIVFLMPKNKIELQKKLNHALKTMWDDGSLYSIKKKYLQSIQIESSQSIKSENLQ